MPPTEPGAHHQLAAQSWRVMCCPGREALAKFRAYDLLVRLAALAAHAIEGLGNKAAICHERCSFAQGLPTRTDQAVTTLVERDDADPFQNGHILDNDRVPRFGRGWVFKDKVTARGNLAGS